MSSRDVLLSDQITKTLPDFSPHQSTCSIFKVPGHLCRVNERAYEPEIISVGPYHRGKDNLKMMEENKKWYLKKLLGRLLGNSLLMYVMVIRDEVERARQCYDQSVSLDEDEFVEMLLLDGCFIVELIRKFEYPELVDNDDPVTDVSWIFSTIAADMLLLENQLPFFVLRKLFDMTTVMPNEDFFGMTLRFFEWMFPDSGLKNTISGEYKHLLDLVYHNWQQLPSPATSVMSTETMKNKWKFIRYAKKLKKAYIESKKQRGPGSSASPITKWKFIRCAKELEEAGIEFKKKDVPGRLFAGVRFKNGKMSIPSLEIEDRTESLFRNLIAYEQCFQLEHPYVINYTTLMDCLINTQEDVQILRRSGIIENWLGDDEMVCTLFNKLGTNVIYNHPDPYYAEVFDRVNKHCERPHNKWLATLRRDYFNSPWAGISFFAALALLLLTLVQTVFTVMSYVKQ